MHQSASPYSLYTSPAYNAKNVLMLMRVIFMQYILFVAMYVLMNKITLNSTKRRLCNWPNES